MKVNVYFLLGSLSATCIDAWSFHGTAPRGGTAIGDTFGRRSSAASWQQQSKARGSPLWSTAGYESYNDNDDKEEDRKQPYRDLQSSQRRTKALMDRGNLIREQVQESNLEFSWLSDQLVSLTTHLRERYQELREMAAADEQGLSEQDEQMLQWLEDELEAVHEQLDGYGRIVAATLNETPDDYALQRELNELAELSQQIQLALGQVPDSDREEMEQAYVKTQSSLGRLTDLRQELADIESALDEMESDSVSTSLMYSQDDWEDDEWQDEDMPDEAAWETAVTGYSPSFRTRTSSTQLRSHFQQLAGEWQASEQEQPIKSSASDPEGRSLYDQRTQMVASAAAAGKSRWGNMENSLASVLSAQISNQPIEEVLPNTGFTAQPDRSLYDKRTQTVAAAAAAGKSRWGMMENQRATMISEGSTTTTQEEFRVKPDRPPSLYGQRIQNVATSPQLGKSRMADSTSPSFESPLEYLSDGPKGSNGFVTEVDSQSPGIAPGFGQRTQELASQTGVGAGPESASTTPSGASQLYSQRRQKVAASSFAGKSRWGEMETDRARTGASIAGAQERASPPPPKPSSPSASTFARGDTSLYDLRAQQVSASAAAGKSRWGSMENQKSSNSAGLKQALDTLGQGIPEAAYVPPPSQVSHSPTDPSVRSMPADATLYDQRNAQIAEAAAAGMGRWGSMETEKASNAFGLKQALDTLGPIAQEFAPRTPPRSSPPPPVSQTQAPPPPPPVVPPPAPAPFQPKGSSTTVDPMAQLAREWAAMNRSPDSSSKPSQPSPPQPKAQARPPVQAVISVPVQPQVASDPEPVSPPPAQPKGSSVAEDPMAQLAREWAAMNRDPDTRSFSPPPPPPPPRPVEPQVASTPPPMSNPMDDLAREWAARNMDPEGMRASGPPAPIPEPPVPPPSEPVIPAPLVIPNDWDRLAQEWANMNSDH